MVLEAKSGGVGVAAVVKEGHGGEDCSTHWNDVELGDVITLEDALGHLEAISGSNLEVAEQQGGDKDDRSGHLWGWVSWITKEPIEMKALGHEDSLCSFFQEIFKVPFVCVSSQIVYRTIGSGVEHLLL